MGQHFNAQLPGHAFDGFNVTGCPMVIDLHTQSNKTLSRQCSRRVPCSAVQHPSRHNAAGARELPARFGTLLVSCNPTCTVYDMCITLPAGKWVCMGQRMIARVSTTKAGQVHARKLIAGAGERLRTMSGLSTMRWKRCSCGFARTRRYFAGASPSPAPNAHRLITHQHECRTVEQGCRQSRAASAGRAAGQPPLGEQAPPTTLHITTTP